jgi:endonuclease/exonuclease/phosphatase family metal-dependent hydrolase
MNEFMIRVMGFNIRYGAADDGANAWDHRKSLVIARIRAFSPNLLGLQECQDDAQEAFVREQLGNYAWYGVRREGDEPVVEMAPLLYEPSVFEELDRGHFWLSETPDVPGSTGWDSWFPRTVVWAHLRDKRSSRPLFFVNTHFDYAPQASEKSADRLGEWISRTVQNHPVIISGDFNADKESAAYKRLTSEQGLFDVFREVHPDRYREVTYHGYGLAEDAGSIDWILASRHFEVMAAEIDTFREGDVFPSDHYPVTAILDWARV